MNKEVYDGCLTKVVSRNGNCFAYIKSTGTWFAGFGPRAISNLKRKVNIEFCRGKITDKERAEIIACLVALDV